MRQFRWQMILCFGLLSKSKFIDLYVFGILFIVPGASIIFALWSSIIFLKANQYFARITLILSGPPLAFAASTRQWQASEMEAEE